MVARSKRQQYWLVSQQLHNWRERQRRWTHLRHGWKRSRHCRRSLLLQFQQWHGIVFRERRPTGDCRPPANWSRMVQGTQSKRTNRPRTAELSSRAAGIFEHSISRWSRLVGSKTRNASIRHVNDAERFTRCKRYECKAGETGAKWQELVLRSHNEESMWYGVELTRTRRRLPHSRFGDKCKFEWILWTFFG